MRHLDSSRGHPDAELGASVGTSRRQRHGVLLTIALAYGCGAAPAIAPGGTLSEPPRAVGPACDAASFDEVAHDLRDYFCNTAEGSIASSEIESCDDIQVTLEQPVGTGHGLDARVLRLATPTGQVFSLLVCAGGRTEPFLLEDLWDVTDEEATTESEGTVALLELVDLVPGGASELRLDVAFARSREVWHGCTFESQLSERTIVCEATASGPRCAEVATLTRLHAECDDLCLVRQLAEDDHDCVDEGAPSYDRELRLALELEAGRARVIESSAVDVPAPVGLVGDHAIEELFSLAPVEPLVVLSEED